MFLEMAEDSLGNPLDLRAVELGDEDFLCQLGEPNRLPRVSPLCGALWPAGPGLFLGALAPRWPAPGYCLSRQQG